jgi:predicted Zn-dependent peptidase
VGIDVLADMLLHSKLEQVEIDRERTVVQQELKANHDNPGAWAGRLFGQAVYGDQPCGWDVGGSVELVDGMNRPDFLEHIGAWYHGPSHVLSVAGNVTHAQVMDRAEALFSGMTRAPLPDVLPYSPDTTGVRVATDSRAIDQCSVYMGTAIFGRYDARRFALRVMNDILGSGMSSRLFREVRERRGLAYSVGSGYGYLADAGSFTISAGVNRDKLAETISVCLEEAQKLTGEAIPHEEMRKAKDHIIGRFRLSLETAYSLGQRHGELILTRGEVEPVEEFVAGIEAVTEDDVRKVEAEVIRRDAFHCAVVGPDMEDDEIAMSLGA